MVTPGDIKRLLHESYGVDVPYAEIKEVLNELKPTVEGECEKRVKGEIWEPGELIGNIDPLEHPNEIIRRTLRSEGARAYKIYIDGRLVIFQWCDPTKPGNTPMTEANVEELMKKAVEQQVERMVNTELTKRAIEKLLELHG